MLFSGLKYCCFSLKSRSISFWHSVFETSRTGEVFLLWPHISPAHTDSIDDAVKLMHCYFCTIQLDCFIDCYTTWSEPRLVSSSHLIKCTEWWNERMCPNLVILIWKVTKINLPKIVRANFPLWWVFWNLKAMILSGQFTPEDFLYSCILRKSYILRTPGRVVSWWVFSFSFSNFLSFLCLPPHPLFGICHNLRYNSAT